jgi:D-alanyl-D-alanine carboxypeptidase/D-alanyl-D-alanine-endopeptidase (penicillin-binding protein 4)
VDTAPLYNLRSFDCVTYIEHVVALAQSRQWQDFLPALLALRYNHGAVGYRFRNHFFVADWLTNNAPLVNVIDPPAAVKVSRTIYRREFFKRKGIDTELPDTLLDLSLWPVDTVCTFIRTHRLAPGVYIAAQFKKGRRHIDANHTGLLFVDDSVSVLCDASRLHGTVVQRNAAGYLKSQAQYLEGVLVARIIDRNTPAVP